MSQTPKDEATFLSPEDLGSFRIRRMAVEASVASTQMIQAGFKAWGDGIKAKYLLDGPFDVDIESGEIVSRPEKKENG